jgi:hypothetical protein
MENKKMNNEAITVEQWLSGVTGENNPAYIKTETGFRLRDDLCEKADAEAKYIWEHGGKEIHDKLQRIPNFDETQEYQDFMAWARGEKSEEMDYNEFALDFKDVETGDTALVEFKIFGKGIGVTDFAEITRKEGLNKEYPKQWENKQPFVYGVFQNTVDDYLDKENVKNALAFLKYGENGIAVF